MNWQDFVELNWIDRISLNWIEVAGFRWIEMNLQDYRGYRGYGIFFLSRVLIFTYQKKKLHFSLNIELIDSISKLKLGLYTIVR